MVETGPTAPVWELPLHPYSEALIDAIPHPDGSGLPARGAARRGARPGAAAERLPLPPPLPVRVRPLPRRGAAARRARRRPRRCLLAPARGRRAGRPGRARRQLVAELPTSNSVEEPPTTRLHWRTSCEEDFRRGASRWLVPLAAARRAASVLVAAYGVNQHASASPTLVIDNSFTIKTSDPQRAFDPTASIVDRAIYDTLFTYKGGDLAHPIPLLVSSWKAIDGREDVHLPAQAERPLRERHAADVGRRRLLAAAAGQPEGQPVVPARRRHGHGRRASTRS